MPISTSVHHRHDHSNTVRFDVDAFSTDDGDIGTLLSFSSKLWAIKAARLLQDAGCQWRVELTRIRASIA